MSIDKACLLLFLGSGISVWLGSAPSPLPAPLFELLIGPQVVMAPGGLVSERAFIRRRGGEQDPDAGTLPGHSERVQTKAWIYRVPRVQD